MKKTVILSILAILLLTPSAQAEQWEGRHHIKKVHHVANRHHIRPHRRVTVHRPHRRLHIRRPNHVRLVHRVGHRIHRLHRRAIHLNVGGLGYRYLGGAFYRPYRSGFRVVHAPIGAIIHTLPVGFMQVRVNNSNYYRYEDTYYRPCSSGYRVVETPTQCNTYRRDIDTNYQYQIGDIAYNLPAGAIEVIIDGKRYYEAEGRYFLQAWRDGKEVYEVVMI